MKRSSLENPRAVGNFYAKKPFAKGIADKTRKQIKEMDSSAFIVTSVLNDPETNKTSLVISVKSKKNAWKIIENLLPFRTEARSKGFNLILSSCD